MSEWKPIDTAPKDGTTIKVKIAYEDDEVLVHWNNSYSIHGLGGHWAVKNSLGVFGDLHLEGWIENND